MMKLNPLLPGSLAFILLILSFAGKAQTGWQYFQNPALHPKAVLDLAADAGGNLWYVSGSVLGRYDGNTWTTSDFTTAGINIQYNFLRSLTHTPDGKVWCGSFDRVLEYTPAGGQWNLHNPYNSAINLNAYGITSDASGKIYWATTNGWAEWDGTQWNQNWYYFQGSQGLGIEERGIRDVLTDPAGDPWFVTSGSIGIETGNIVPAGLIHRTATDTNVYKMGELGFPEVLSLPVTQNQQGNPMVLVSTTNQGGQQRKLRILSYEFGAWQDLGEAPTTSASGVAIYQDPIGNVWIAGENSPGQPIIQRRYPNGAWESWLLDHQKIDFLHSITGTPDGSIWAGGRLGAQGALVKLPGQFISSAPEVPEGCPEPALICDGGWLFAAPMPADSDGRRCTVFDACGRQLANFSMNELGRGISVAHWPSGIYFMAVAAEGNCPARALRFVR
jgi:hypothetical protein